jgi:hypothetical protein
MKKQILAVVGLIAAAIVTSIGFVWAQSGAPGSSGYTSLTTGSVNTGATGNMAYYAAGGAAISPDTYIAESGGTSLTLTDPNIFVSGNVELGDAKSLIFYQTAAGSGAAGASLGVVGTGATEYLSPSVPFYEAGACKFNATTLVATSNPGTTFCTITLPNIAENFFLDCKLSYVDGGTYTMGLTYQFAAAPTNTSISAEVKSSNANVATEATNTTGGTTENTIITGAAPGGALTLLASVYGSFTSNAASGTLLIKGFSSSASGITVSGACRVF